MKKIIIDWLEEGFMNFEESLKRKKREDSLIPCILNNLEENIAPKPLFPAFFNNTELDSEFLINYFEIIQNSLRFGKFKSKESSDELDSTTEQSLYKNKIVLDITYERKDIFLSKTIFPLFELSDTYVSNLSTHYSDVLSKNKLYSKALEFRKDFPDQFYDKSSQIGYSELCEKQIETIPIILVNNKSLVTSYLMKKYYYRNEVYVKPPIKSFEQYIHLRTKFRSYEEFLTKIPDHPDIFQKLKYHLYVLEKTLDYNTYENTIKLFNDYDDTYNLKPPLLKVNSESEEVITLETDKVCIKLHLNFHLSILESDYQVTCIDCNHSNVSIFVCGYGVPTSLEMNHEPRGLILCWNIHKCSYPEKIYYMQEVVTCVEISKSRPYLIAVGMRFGLIAIIDLRYKVNSPILTNKTSNMRPTSPIKSLRWIVKQYSLEAEEEILLALSLEGIITAWNIEKTLEGYILKTIKQKSTKFNKNKHSLLTNSSVGVCMYVKPSEENIFAIGSIEGEVHIVSFSNPDDNIEVKRCHFGAVNDIEWSVLAKNVFMTCGTDRCVHIWEMHKLNPSKSLIFSENVLKVTLSAVKSTVFAVMTKAKVFIFDLDINLHHPVIEIKSPDNIFYTYITFCPSNNWILVGHSNGVTYLYEIANVSNFIASKSRILRQLFLPE